ncbi:MULTISPECIES: hypothetical protein [unclassified Photorhabdus]|nr:hypothetical protein [Photorhabdus sp. S10-54]
MFSVIIARINQAIDYQFENQQGLSLDFYCQIKEIRDSIRAISYDNPRLHREFCQQQTALLSRFDSKIIAYEKKYETTIANLMRSEMLLAERDIFAAYESKNTFVELYRSLYFAERKLLEHDPRHICHVGCGPMPVSVLMWMKYTNAQITAIDFDGDAIDSARGVFEHWHHQKGIPADRAKFVTTLGENFDYSGIDLIVISASVLNKENIYSAILNTATETVNVIERTPNFLYNVQFTSPEGFSSYQLDNKERENLNLRFYQFTPQRGEHHGK